MGLEIRIDTFQILKGYSKLVSSRTCRDEDKENFEKCPVRIYLNTQIKKHILLLEINSNKTEKKLHYSTSITINALISADKEPHKQPYSIYFVYYKGAHIYGYLVNEYTFDILSNDLSFGLDDIKQCTNNICHHKAICVESVLKTHCICPQNTYGLLCQHVITGSTIIKNIYTNKTDPDKDSLKVETQDTLTKTMDIYFTDIDNVSNPDHNIFYTCVDATLDGSLTNEDRCVNGFCHLINDKSTCVCHKKYFGAHCNLTVNFILTDDLLFNFYI
ncbi:hypothetical protein RF11_10256 [Thelohanellus kitauei]|uniref:EGF-like domain-containing protein n=1 Tax=Thelohanellus kitauei TaxID=669202 RepID=A0A0C2JRY3_THEKT|nr:hypothetical protein RF11_10256 [Thelohanellus kitauei]